VSALKAPEVIKILRMAFFACCAASDKGRDKATVDRIMPAVNKLMPK
jgi:hypothetical protein